MLADILSIALVATAVIMGAVRLDVALPLALLAPLPVLLVVVFALTGLYGGAVALHPVQELELVATMTGMVFVTYAIAVGAVHLVLALPPYATATDLLVIGALCLVTFPTVRAVSRVTFARTAWWGTPAVVLASSGTALPVVLTLQRWPELGMKPVAVLDDAPESDDVAGVPVLGRTRLAPRVAAATRRPIAIVALPQLSARRLSDRVRRYSRFFEHVIVVPEMPGTSPLWTAGPRIDGLLGYGVRHYTHGRLLRTAKRGVDVAASLCALLVLSPLLLAIALLIKLDSPGPVFYRQLRMGREGRCFHMLKFRSMHPDAEARLQTLLRDDPALRAEYDRYHKLRDDPRVTTVGRVLRRYSLDELPQLLNVMLGHLSLVGPRAYLPRELRAMEGVERAVLQYRPGVTGLWQVSGRNTVPFHERLTMDVHYVQNWTPALDLYILAKTLPVILCGEGTA